MFPFFAPQGILIYFPLRGWVFLPLLPLRRGDLPGFSSSSVIGTKTKFQDVSLIKENQVFSSLLSFADN